MMETNEERSILEKYRTIAVVGLSRDQSKDSYRVAEYLRSKGYLIIPINPSAEQILAQKCYRSLLEIPEELQGTIEIVDIFRSSQDVLPIVDQTIQLRSRFGNPQVIWMQLGIVNEEAAKKARDAGLKVVMDRCIAQEHRRLFD